MTDEPIRASIMFPMSPIKSSIHTYGAIYMEQVVEQWRLQSLTYTHTSPHVHPYTCTLRRYHCYQLIYGLRSNIRKGCTWHSTTYHREKKEEAGRDKQLSCYLAFCHRCRLCNKQKETTTRLTSTYHRMSPHGAGAIVKLDRRVAEDSQLLVYDLLS